VGQPTLASAQVFLPTVTAAVTAVTILPFLPPRHGNGTVRSKPLGFKKNQIEIKNEKIENP
jgi:hypothetical protein